MDEESDQGFWDKLAYLMTVWISLVVGGLIGNRVILSCGNCQEGDAVYTPDRGLWTCDTCHCVVPEPPSVAKVVELRSELTNQDVVTRQDAVQIPTERDRN